jgi:hypothetical protein
MNKPWSFDKIGSCYRCMRQSFLACAAAWAAWAAAAALSSYGGTAGWIVSAALALACLLTGLWVLHMVVFSARASASARAVPGEKPESVPAIGVVQLPARRSFIRNFVAALGGMMLATAVPSLALAQSPCPGRLTCNNTRCSSNGIYCCPQGYAVLNACNCKCYETLEGVHRAGCRTHNVCSSW